MLKPFNNERTNITDNIIKKNSCIFDKKRETRAKKDRERKRI